MLTNDSTDNQFASILGASSLTENGALTYNSAGSDCLDLFFRGGAMRASDEASIRELFQNAWDESPEHALKCLFYLRDVRGGQGERKFFRTALHCIPESSLIKNIPNIPEYGRWDDIFALIGLNSNVDKAILSCIRHGIAGENALLAKWLPREKSAKKALAIQIRKGLGMTPKQYRKMCSTLSSTVEQQMSAGNWDEINFEHCPSVAMLRYRKAFSKQQADRFCGYLEACKSGEKKINAGAVYPHQIVQSANEPGADAMWDALPNYTTEASVMPMIDVSASMNTPVSTGSTTCKNVAIGLGMYLAEKGKGPFKDLFMTFSTEPAFVKLKGSSLLERVQNVDAANWDMSTNINAAFDLLLQKAVAHSIDQKDLPNYVLILSDMEFDACTDGGWHGDTSYNTNWQRIREQYHQAGYRAPICVFWNIQSRGSTTPVRMNDDEVALVSGFSPSVLTFLMAGSIPNPMDVFLDVVNSPRYAQIKC